MQRKDKNYVYFIKQNEFVKIGRSNKPFKRLNDMQVSTPYELKLVGFVPCQNMHYAKVLENRLHSQCKKSHIRGEWFKDDVLDGIFETYPVSHSKKQIKLLKRNHVGKFELLRFYGLQHSPSDILFPI
jgi:hypothetical protein